jgi:hypothetical protein
MRNEPLLGRIKNERDEGIRFTRRGHRIPARTAAASRKLLEPTELHPRGPILRRSWQAAGGEVRDDPGMGRGRFPKRPASVYQEVLPAQVPLIPSSPPRQWSVPGKRILGCRDQEYKVDVRLCVLNAQETQVHADVLMKDWCAI